ncbi:MAG: cobalamin biosynthesis protein P47K [Phycisphaeraceae bacterium]
MFLLRFSRADAGDRRVGAGGGRGPDVVLAEPVGSCTDLVSTVIRPLLDRHGNRIELGPYPVLLKPAHARQALLGEPGELSVGAAYIYRKQLEEADAVVINRIDEVSDHEAEQLAELVREKLPHATVLKASARTGEGFDAIVDLLTREGSPRMAAMDVDYALYAQGEADLGWLNATASLAGESDAQLDYVLIDAMEWLRQALSCASAVVAHVKMLGQQGDAQAVVNLVSTAGDVVLSKPADAAAARARLVVNARVAMEPGSLESAVREALQAAATAASLEIDFGNVACFQPAPPQPTYRIA